MSTQLSSVGPSKTYTDPTKMPSDVPHVDELGVTSGPLKSASFFIGAHCKAFNEDFMLCKAENRDPEHCLKEGRRVTRCARDLIEKLKANCGQQYDTHWNCLEGNNQEFERCRPEEKAFNQCVFDKLGYKKEIPGTPQGEEPIHEKSNPIFKKMQK